VDSQPLAVDGDHPGRRQALRREMNEQLRRASRRNGDSGTLRLLCECGRCNDHVVIAGESYEQAGVPLVKPGHEAAIQRPG